MRLTTSFWLSGTVLAALVCQSAFEGRQASASPNNPLRANSASTASAADATGGSEVRFVGGIDDTDFAPSAFDEQSCQSSSGDYSVHSSGAADSAAAAFGSETRSAAPTARYDDQVEPAAYYQNDRRPAPRRPSPPPPIYHGLREESHVPTPTQIIDIQPRAERSQTEPEAPQDRFHGPGGLRVQPQRSAAPQPTARPQQYNAQPQRVAAAQRPPRPRPNNGSNHEYQSAVPIARAAPERTLKMALAGVSPSSQPASSGKLAGLPAEQLLRKAHEWAAVARSEDDYTRVIDACQKAMRLKPNAVSTDYGQTLAAWSFNRRGQLRSQSGEQQLAMSDFNAAVRLDPQCWRALHNRGVLLAIEHKFEPAFDDFNRTVAINPAYAKAYANRAALFVVAGQLQPALVDYRRAVELEPTLVTAQRGQARVCHLLGKLDEALEHYDLAVRLAPRDAYTIARRAELLTDLGRYTEAATDYDQAIQLDPQLASAYRGSAWLLATCPDETVSDPEQAVQRAELAVRLTERPTADCYDTLAAAQASEGNFKAAQQTVRRAIKLAPENQRADYLRRLAMYQQSQPYRLGEDRSVQQASYKR